MKPNNFNDAQREQTSILAPLERRVLHAIVRRMPAPVNSDHLSILGLLGMLFAGVCYAASRHNSAWLYAVNVCIFLNWFGDSLDGTFGALFLILGLAISGYMSERVAAVLLVVFMMLAINSYLAAYALGVFKISQWKMGPTEMRLLLMVGNMFLIHRPYTKILGHRYLLYDVGGVVAIIGMGFILIFLSLQNTHTLYQMERLPKPESRLPQNVSLDQV